MFGLNQSSSGVEFVHLRLRNVVCLRVDGGETDLGRIEVDEERFVGFWSEMGDCDVVDF